MPIEIARQESSSQGLSLKRTISLDGRLVLVVVTVIIALGRHWRDDRSHHWQRTHKQRERQRVSPPFSINDDVKRRR